MQNFDCAHNAPFTIQELEHALSLAKDTTPGQDGVAYKMLRNIPDQAKMYLLSIYNQLYNESYFPPSWGKAVIIPIPKSGKNLNSLESYRPLALTSCVCKLMERLFNSRLMEYLIMHKILTPVQSGGQKGRSTVEC